MMFLSMTGSQSSPLLLDVDNPCIIGVTVDSCIMSRKNSCFALFLRLLVKELTVLNDKSFSVKRLFPSSKLSSGGLIFEVSPGFLDDEIWISSLNFLSGILKISQFIFKSFNWSEASLKNLFEFRNPIGIFFH